MAGLMARRFGWNARFGQTERDRPQSTERLIDQALEDGCSRLVIIGGDGTLHRTVNRLHERRRLKSTEVALVPAGTCNDFARAMGLRVKRVEESFRIACSEKPREIDLGEMQGELFVNNAGFGRRKLATVPGAGRRPKPLRTLQSFAPVTLKAQWDKGSISGSFYMAMACNGPYFSKGFYFSKTTVANDGMLDCFLLPAMAKWRLIPLLMMGKLGRPVRSKHTIMLRVSQLSIEAQSDLWPQADGEPVLAATRRVHFAISKEKLQLVASHLPRKATLVQ